MSSNAIDVRFFYPPDTPFKMIPPTSVSKHFYSFISLASILTFSFLYSYDTLSFNFAAKFSVYLTVIDCIKTSVCMT